MSNVAPISAPSPSVLKRIFFALLFFVVLLSVAGFLYENVSEARDRRFNPMEGKMVAVNGQKMHIDCLGDSGPTVILDSGLGDSYVSWRKVQPEIARFVRVCSYDRAGLGYSDSSSRSRTSKDIAEELHALLQAAQVAPPYVLVGHSMAGYDIRLYTSLYPKEVAGLVFVDASHPDQDNRFPPELKNLEGSWGREAEFLAYSHPFGLPRLLDFCDTNPVDRAANCNFHSALENYAELKAFPQSAAQAASTGPFGDIPLVVLSHDPDRPSSDLPPDLAKPVNDAWDKMQEELSHLSTRGSRVIAKGSAHYIQSDRPELVIDAIRKVVTDARASAPSSAPS